MSQLSEMLTRLNPPEGFSESVLKGVHFMKAVHHIPRSPLLYDSGIYIIAQGNKVGYLGGERFEYDTNNYLVVSVAMPFECETFASPENPLLGLFIEIDALQLYDIISLLRQDTYSPKDTESLMPKGIGPAPLEQDMFEAAVRLVNSLNSKTKSNVLGAGIIREILFHALHGTQSSVLFSLASHNDKYARIARAIKFIHNHYSNKIDIEKLANQTNMSTSSFHRHFKEITSESPIQYLKKTRLNMARNILLQENVNANIVAKEVGYESESQFSREFKRYFAELPSSLKNKSTVKQNITP
ncbi:MAG: AraC family transcriptional regulator [Piscirickettsiaceae bacterium]|nr:MAG: AraC family transcriptional regulator [Piscirickettsiaceae bacterium]